MARKMKHLIIITIFLVRNILSLSVFSFLNNSDISSHFDIWYISEDNPVGSSGNVESFSINGIPIQSMKNDGINPRLIQNNSNTRYYKSITFTKTKKNLGNFIRRKEVFSRKRPILFVVETNNHKHISSFLERMDLSMEPVFDGQKPGKLFDKNTFCL